MKTSSHHPAGDEAQPPFAERGGASPLVLLLVLLIGLAVGALLVYQTTKSPAAKPQAEPSSSQVNLSESTKAVLARLDSPVELRLYVLFSDDNASPALREHAARVNELASEFERFGNGRIVVSRFNTWSRENTQNAATDGLTPLALPHGDPGYIGLAVRQDNRKEALPQIAPEWFSALEFDIARAIARVGSTPTAPPSAEDLTLAKQAEASISKVIPRSADTTLEDGKRLLRDTALKAYQTLVGEMNREVQKAEQVVQNAATEADRRAALQKLQQLRAGYAERLREIAQTSQAELEAWTRLKAQ